MAVKKTVWIGDDNKFVLGISSIDIAGVEAPVDLSSIYSMLLLLQGSALPETEYTSLGVGQVVDTSLGAGQIRLMLGQIAGLTAGEYQLRLRYKTSAGDAAPTQIVHESDAPMKVTIKAVLPAA